LGQFKYGILGKFKFCLTIATRDKLGITLEDYFLKVRIDKAKDLLMERNSPILQIAFP